MIGSIGEKLRMSTVQLEDILPELPPLTQAQREEINRRLEAHSKNPEDVESWDEVKASIERR